MHYPLEQWPYLVRYLEDGRLRLSNGHAERGIKPFVIGRKNGLLSNASGLSQMKKSWAESLLPVNALEYRIPKL